MKSRSREAAMNQKAGPTWASGLRPVEINPRPASFINFFPERDATPSDIPWADHLAAPRPITRLPAWCRVAVEAHPSTHRTGLIMKRISLQRYRALGASITTLPASAETTENGEEGRRVRPRLSSFVPSDAETMIAGGSPSEAENVSSLLKAKVVVANHYYKHITIISAEENMQSRTNRYFRTIPRKRPLSEGDEIVERDDVTNGNRLRTYAELARILGRAAEGGAGEINLSMASSAEASAALLQSGRDPRVYLAAKGVPELSIITDVTELPDSPMALPKLPSARSPVKRLFGLSSPIKTPTKRLAESMVPLLPGSSPKAEPSPTKSSSPSTPYKESPRIVRLPSSPAGFPKSPIPMQSPLQKRRTSQSPSRNILFETPSKAASSSFLRPGSANARDTPSKKLSKFAITPSKTKVLEPATPYQMFTPRAATPSQTDSPLGLMASLPFYFQAIPSPVRPVVVGDVKKIDFGASSPSFAHASWLQPPVNAGEIQRSQNVSKALRRRSEPLARSLHKAKIRKRSMSPRKLNAHNIEASIVSLQDNENDDTIIHHTVLDAVSEDVTTEDAAYPSSPIQPLAATILDTPSKTALKQNPTIVEVDMHKNQDIFGTQTSPAICGNPAIEQLARMAQDRCDGGANVKVSQDDDKLFVRFKLPTKFAPMFPENQGDEESRFMSSPSLSTSPRLRFKDSVAIVEEPAGGQGAIANQMPSDPGSSPHKDARAFAASSSPSHIAIPSCSHGPLAKTPLGDTANGSLPDADNVDDGTTMPDLESCSHPVPLESPEHAKSSSSPSHPKSTPSAAPISEAPSCDVAASTPPAQGSAMGKTSSGKQAGVASSIQGHKRESKAITFSSPIDELSSFKSTDEGPGHARVREFIKRPKAKRLSSSSNCSPTVTLRQPLVVKSPNADSVPRPSRKHDIEDTEGDLEMLDEAMPKKAGNIGRLSEAKPIIETPTKTIAALATTTQDNSDVEAEAGAEDPDADELGMEFSTASAARRSTRLRGKGTPAKSSIPVPGKAGRGKAGLSSVRTEQQDLTRQTLANTRRNKGKAVSAKKALQRLSEEVQVQVEDNVEPDSEDTALKGGKSVVWKEPLTAYGESNMEEEKTAKMTGKPKRGRGASKATAQGKAASGRVAKAAPKAATGTQKQQIAKAAAAMSRSGSGTPARVTRSRART